MADAVANPEPSSLPAAPAADGSRPRSPDKGRLRVFISYSRVDHDFADQLAAALDACGFESVIDREDISGGEDWKNRLGALITEADTVVFVLSPASAESGVCAWEVQRSVELGKRLLPVVCRALGAATPPARLQSLNYVFFYPDPEAPGSGFGQGLRLLAQALNTDFDWLREHTRYLERATEWDQGGRPSIRLLTGSDIAEAKAWAASRPRTAPEPTALQLDFFHSSEGAEQARTNEELQRLRALKDATDEREAALREKEAAVERAQDEQRRRAKTAIARNLLLLTSCLGAVAAVIVSFSASNERKHAEALLERAKPIVAAAQDRMDRRTRQQALEFFETAAGYFNDPAAVGYVGVSYRNGWGLGGRDYAKAINYLNEAARRGDRNAMDNLGAIYDSGEAAASGFAGDLEKARDWYEKASDGPGGLAASMVNLARIYDQGRGLAAPDTTRARAIYRQAADKSAGAPRNAPEDYEPGQAEAMFALGELDREGRGAPADPGGARSWYEKAARAGHAGAMVRLAEMDEAGLGAAENLASALARYEAAARQNDPKSMFRLGDLTQKGRGLDQDTGEAVYWFERAASFGDRNAMSALGTIYETGPAIARNPAKAAAWRAAGEGKGDPPLTAREAE